MTFTALELTSEHACFGGVQRFYKHSSSEIGLPMRFGVFAAPGLAGQQVPALTYLAGLTCTEETFAIKAGAQRLAAELGLAILTPDTSPRGANMPGESRPAGTLAWAPAFTWTPPSRPGQALAHGKLPHQRAAAAVTAQLPLDAQRLGMFGHSMGGHGALTLALRHPGVFKSVSAFAPICAPTQCPWGHKAFTGYLGQDRKHLGRT
jgi:S-formylglutathione hydrolase